MNLTNPWSRHSPDLMFKHLVGFDFGSNPELQLNEIRAHKAGIAQMILSKLAVSKDDTILDLGSGCGFIANPISQSVENVICCDISISFIEFAKKECSHKNNITFQLIKDFDLGGILDSSLAAAYSYNVFIHLNLFQMYWYLQALAKKIRSGGRLVFDIANANNLEKNVSDFFITFAENFKKNPEDRDACVCWNSPQAVIGLAKDAGFNLIENIEDSFFVFERKT